jgi:hypothetical protein
MLTFTEGIGSWSWRVLFSKHTHVVSSPLISAIRRFCTFFIHCSVTCLFPQIVMACPLFIGETFTSGRPFFSCETCLHFVYFRRIFPADCKSAHCVLLCAQSKVLMLKRGNGVKNERKMTGNLPRDKRRRIRNNKKPRKA